MARKLAIGVAWWLALAYGLQFAAFMYGFPTAVAPVAALAVATLIAVTRPLPKRRPEDLRRIYRPKEDTVAGLPEPSTLTNS